MTDNHRGTVGDARSRPAPLLVAAAVVALEGALMVVLAALELLAVDGARVAMGVSTALFFAAYGAGLLVCARALRDGQSWARSPVVLAQLIQVGVAWSFFSSTSLTLTLAIVAVSLVVLVGLFHPASIEALTDDPTRHRS